MAAMVVALIALIAILGLSTSVATACTDHPAAGGVVQTATTDNVTTHGTHVIAGPALIESHCEDATAAAVMALPQHGARALLLDARSASLALDAGAVRSAPRAYRPSAARSGSALLTLVCVSRT